ncbi:MAG TPA: VIT and VWA domain-containing protein [Isosphaeraceae bacterium]|jgi:Ca-activated chloride channel family protein|nr:VIT and VWA domain-containing protein [Isosphaeraceae bacterium]
MVRPIVFGIPLGLAFGALLSATSAAQQVPRPWAANVVVPQTSCYTMGRRPAVRIEQVRAGVVIRGQVATTMVEVRLRNPGPGRLEAELLMPVPDGATVRGFSYDGPGREPTARLLPRDEARRTYDQIVAQARDPALLEFAGSNLVRSSVFPVEGGGTQAVRLTYEHLLPADGDRIDYVLPRSESVEYRVPWKVSVKVDAAGPIAAVYSPSHAVRTSRPAAGVALVELEAEAATDPGPFRLSYLRERAGVSASLFAYPDPRLGGGYFLLLAGLPPEPKGKAAEIRREVTLVIDRSGSMRGEKLDQVREAARQVIAGLDEGESFNLVLYNEGVDPFRPRPVRKSRATEREARRFLDAMTARGGTNLHDALLEALRPAPAEGTLPIVLFMTDGLATVGQTAESAIRDLARRHNPHRKRIFSFGVGVDVNTPLLEKIAYENRGFATFILPAEDVEVKVGRVFDRLKGPVLADPELAIGGDGPRRATELIPDRLPDLFEGDQIVLLGQYRGDEPLQFTLRGNHRGTPRTFRFRLSLDGATTRNGFVPRLWASRKIGLLVDAVRAQGADPAAPLGAKQGVAPMARELVEEIVRLSTEFGILTEYTAFLAREGTDLSKKEDLLSNAGDVLRSRAIRTRTGYASVNQEINNQKLKALTCVNPRNKFLGPDMSESATATVQQVCDLAFFKRGDRWVDSRLLNAAPEAGHPRVISFGSDEFRELTERLAREGRQGSIALRGDILLQVDGRPVLIRAPGKGPDANRP